MARALPTPQHDERASDGIVAVLPPDDRPLHLNEAGLSLIRQRLEEANRDNPDFVAQRDRLLGAVSMALDGLVRHFAPEIERVVALGEWAFTGIDLRALPDIEDLVLEVVVRAERRDFDFDRRVSLAVASRIREAYIDGFLLQLSVLPLPLWHRAKAYAQANGRSEESLGVPLLVRE